MSTALSPVALQHVPTVPGALKALGAMARQLESAKTYNEIRKIVDAAAALKLLFKNVDAVKAKAEDVILAASARIGEEIRKVPKATAPHGKKAAKNPSRVKDSKSGRERLGISSAARSRFQKLADAKPKLKAIAKRIRESGGDATVGAVLRELKFDEIQKRRADNAARTERGCTVDDLVTLPESGRRFGVIYADPAWPFVLWGPRGELRSSVNNEYKTSPIDEIAALPVAALAADDSLLFLWATMPQLPAAFEIIKAWGFIYKTCAFNWVKQNPSGDGLHTGMGYWTRSNSEICLLATKGAPTRLATDVHQIVLAPVGEHSAKPEEVRRRIERLVAGPYLELYGREPADGWTVWGNEIQRTSFPQQCDSADDLVAHARFAQSACEAATNMELVMK
jgi:N6-adenosine-specific RNA methylase IME4